MKLLFIGSTIIKDKKNEPTHKLAKMLAQAVDHIETVEFAYPVVDGRINTDEEIIADIPNKESELSQHWTRLIEGGYKWNQYEQKWFK